MADPKIEKAYPTLLFDGTCNLCNGAVRFVIERDAKKSFKFASLQSESSINKLAQHGMVGPSLDSVVLIRGNQVYLKSDAVLEVFRELGGRYQLMLVFKVVPLVFRDFIYDWIAKHRYGWFGRQDTCMIPTPELQERFLD